jgi:drug/metabolite transporter (DMT)-like permease
MQQHAHHVTTSGSLPAGRSHFPVQAALALAAMLAFCLSDVLAKMLAPAIPPVEIAWFRYLGGVAMLVPVLVGTRTRPRSAAPLIQTLRSVCMVVATALLIAAVQRMPIAEATTLVFVSPIFVALLSATLLGEAIGWTRSACIAAGLAGVVIIARPDPAGMNTAALLPLGSAAFWATAMVLTRVVQARGDTFLTTLAFTALVGFAVLCFALPPFFVLPRPGDLLLLAAMSLSWVAAQVAVLAAYRAGRVADVAPFSYTQIVWAIVLGFAFFGELPDGTALLGCAIVILSGVVAAGMLPRAKTGAAPAAEIDRP